MFEYIEQSDSISNVFFDWFKTLFYGFTSAGEWITQPIIELGDGKAISPLYFLTFGGITAFIVVAIVKWVVS